MAKHLYTSNSKSQNVKFIIVTALVTLVILGIAVWAVVFVVSHSKQQIGTTEAEIAAEPAGGEISAPETVSTDPTATPEDATDPTATPEDATGAEGVSETNDGTNASGTTGTNGSTNSNANGSTGSASSGANASNGAASANGSNGSTNANAAPSKNASSVPDTGPTDFIPLALLAGALVAYGSSRSFARAEERF